MRVLVYLAISLASLAALGLLLGLLLYCVLIPDPWAPQMIDSTGSVPHRVQSTITAQSNWMVGESKNCTSSPLDADTAQAQGKQPGYAFLKVQCDSGPAHNVAITFWGAKNQPDNKVAYWNCTRSADAFTCKQTGAN